MQSAWLARTLLLSGGLLAHGRAISPASIAESTAAASADAGELICPTTDTCYAGTFQPTDTWQRVLPDQIVPPGLHVRLDVTTGEREAKLIDPSDADRDAGDAVDLVVTTDDIAQAANADPETDAVVHRDPAVVDQKPHPPNARAGRAVVTDRQAFDAAILVINATHSAPSSLSASAPPDDASLLAALDTLEDLCHELEFGLLAVRSVSPLLALASAAHADGVRARAALVLGTALRNNANAQRALKDAEPELVRKLLVLIEADPAAPPPQLQVAGSEAHAVTGRLLYALSAAMSGGGGEQQADYLSAGGHATLMRAFEGAGSDGVRGRVVTLVEDAFLTGAAEGAVARSTWLAAFEHAYAVADPTGTLSDKLASAVSKADELYPDYTPSQAFQQQLAARNAGRKDEL